MGIPWVLTEPAIPGVPITLEKNNMQNMIAQTAATLIWLGM